jgi:hypothetical protein
MSLTNQELFLNWIEQVEKSGRCVKYRCREDDLSVDYGTIYVEDFIAECQPRDILEVTSEHFLFLGDEEKREFYNDEYPTDEFGQIGTFRDPPKCFLTYMDKNESDCAVFLRSSDDEFFQSFIEDLDGFMDWANSKYPYSVSYVGEIDEKNAECFWDCYTYNPKYSEEEIMAIIEEYISAN